MICWYCYWGWRAEVAAIYLAALAKLGGDSLRLTCGPAHLVWDDENFDSAEWCLEHFDEYRGEMSDEDADIVRESLERLAAIPADEREAMPADYDGYHPAAYPPPAGLTMVKV